MTLLTNVSCKNRDHFGEAPLLSPTLWICCGLINFKRSSKKISVLIDVMNDAQYYYCAWNFEKNSIGTQPPPKKKINFWIQYNYLLKKKFNRPSPRKIFSFLATVKPIEVRISVASVVHNWPFTAGVKIWKNIYVYIWFFKNLFDLKLSEKNILGLENISVFKYFFLGKKWWIFFFFIIYIVIRLMK